jgi:hypothetical protein
MRNFIIKYIPFGEAKEVAAISGIDQNQITYWKKSKERGGRNPAVMSLIYFVRGICEYSSSVKGVELDYEKVIIEALIVLERPATILPEELPLKKDTE